MKKIISGILILLFMATASYAQESKSPLTLTIKSDKQVYWEGEGISINEELKNVSNKTVKVNDYFKPTSLVFYFRNQYDKKCVLGYSDIIREIMPTEMTPGQSINFSGVAMSLPNNITKHENYKTKGKHVVYLIDGGLTSNTITIEVTEKKIISKEDALKIAERACKESAWEWKDVDIQEGNDGWNIRTNSKADGMNAFIRVDKETGKVLHKSFGPM